MFKEYEIGYELQDKVDFYGLGFGIKELVLKMYKEMSMNDHECTILNDKYLIVDDEKFQFAKNRNEGKWIVKRF